MSDLSRAAAPKIIAVTNQKGGVGKTTSTVSIGASLARNRKRVLLVDCDPQCNLTQWLRVPAAHGEPTLYEILRGQATVRSAAVPTEGRHASTNALKQLSHLFFRRLASRGAH